MIYLYSSTIDNKIYIKKYYFALRNFLINWSKYFPLSSKFLKDILKEIFNDLKSEKLKKNIILFSPAGASFDSFKNFEDRGKYFNQLIKKFLNAK